MPGPYELQCEFYEDESAPRNTPVIDSHPNAPISRKTLRELPAETEEIRVATELPTPGLRGVQSYVIVTEAGATLRIFHPTDERWHKVAHLGRSEDDPQTMEEILDELSSAATRWHGMNVVHAVVKAAHEAQPQSPNRIL